MFSKTWNILGKYHEYCRCQNEDCDSNKDCLERGIYTLLAGIGAGASE